MAAVEGTPHVDGVDFLAGGEGVLSDGKTSHSLFFLSLFSPILAGMTWLPGKVAGSKQVWYHSPAAWASACRQLRTQ